MKILYRKKVSAEKKQLIAAISQFTGEASKYMGPPKMLYSIGGLIIDREGNLLVPDGMDVSALVENLRKQGYEGEIEGAVQGEVVLNTAAAEPATETVTTEESATEAITSEEPDEAVETVIAADEEQSETPVMTDAEEQIESSVVTHAEEQAEEADSFSISIPKSKMPADAMERLDRILESKGKLILKALGASSLKVETDDEKVTFPWFSRIPEPDQVEAYQKFIAALCKMARKQSRVSAKEKDNENEKYAFRCFLLRLGFIGDEYKKDRKILLKNFDGSSAFRTQESADKARAKLEAQAVRA